MTDENDAEETIDQIYRFGRDRMVLPGVDLSCCELPETRAMPPETTACGLQVVENENDDYDEF